MNRVEIFIKVRRVSLGLTQQDLSEMSGVALRTINALERGKASISLKNLRAVMEVLGLELHPAIKKLPADNDTGL